MCQRPSKNGDIDRNRETLCAEFSLGAETLQGLELISVWNWGQRCLSKRRKLVISRSLSRRSVFENQNLLWSDVTGQASALPENFPRKPEVVYADKDFPKLLDTKATSCGIADIQRFGFSARTAYHLGCDWPAGKNSILQPEQLAAVWLL